MSTLEKVAKVVREAAKLADTDMGPGQGECPDVVDAATGHAAADALAFEARYTRRVGLAARAARSIGWGDEAGALEAVQAFEEHDIAPAPRLPLALPPLPPRTS